MHPGFKLFPAADSDGQSVNVTFRLVPPRPRNRSATGRGLAGQEMGTTMFKGRPWQGWPSRAESRGSDSRLDDSAKTSDSRRGDSATRAQAFPGPGPPLVLPLPGVSCLLNAQAFSLFQANILSSSASRLGVAAIILLFE